jgi:hypothetical protein
MNGILAGYHHQRAKQGEYGQEPEEYLRNRHGSVKLF